MRRLLTSFDVILDIALPSNALLDVAGNPSSRHQYGPPVCRLSSSSKRASKDFELLRPTRALEDGQVVFYQDSCIIS